MVASITNELGSIPEKPKKGVVRTCVEFPGVLKLKSMWKSQRNYPWIFMGFGFWHCHWNSHKWCHTILQNFHQWNFSSRMSTRVKWHDKYKSKNLFFLEFSKLKSEVTNLKIPGGGGGLCPQSPLLFGFFWNSPKLGIILVSKLC